MTCYVLAGRASLSSFTKTKKASIKKLFSILFRPGVFLLPLCPWSPAVCSLQSPISALQLPAKLPYSMSKLSCSPDRNSESYTHFFFGKTFLQMVEMRDDTYRGFLQQRDFMGVYSSFCRPFWKTLHSNLIGYDWLPPRSLINSSLLTFMSGIGSL